MLKIVGAAAVVTACAGLLQCWKNTYRARIRELKQLGALYRSARMRMQAEHIAMPLFFRQYASSCRDGGKDRVPFGAEPAAAPVCCGGSEALAVAAFAAALAECLEKRAYATGEAAWVAAAESVEWHLDREELSLLMQSKSAFFGRDIDDNLQKISRMEAQLEECGRRAQAEFAEKSRVWTPVALLLGAMLAVILL